jgi:hypothetical protein
MKILVACERSGKVREAFRNKGHDAYSCDIYPADDSSIFHYQRDVMEILDRGWDMIIAFPDCTYLTVTGNKWFKDQPPRKSGALVGHERRQAREKAVDFFMKIANANCDKIAIENPVGVMSKRWRKPDQIICPSMFGHKEPKKTCLWLKNLPLLESTKVVKKEYVKTKSGKNMAKWYYYADKTKGGPYRAKIRSITFQGIADAMADQWG